MYNHKSWTIRPALSLIGGCLSSTEPASIWNAISRHKQLFQYCRKKWIAGGVKGRGKRKCKKQKKQCMSRHDLIKMTGVLCLWPRTNLSWPNAAGTSWGGKRTAFSLLHPLLLPLLCLQWARSGWRLAYDMTDYIKSHRCSALWH